MKMISKKAQGEIITTVLIILLVLAAIVIVWQVVNGTVKKGGEAVTTQSECLGLSIDVTLGGVSNNITVKPNKPVDAIRVYTDGQQLIELSALGAFASNTTQNSTSKAVITSAGKMGTQWCDGLNSVVMP